MKVMSRIVGVAAGCAAMMVGVSLLYDGDVCTGNLCGGPLHMSSKGLGSSSIILSCAGGAMLFDDDAAVPLDGGSGGALIGIPEVVLPYPGCCCLLCVVGIRTASGCCCGSCKGGGGGRFGTSVVRL